ncbi:hypothetical protein GUJ93_ZPchr0001g30845 [Zizania palustris]|uniref:Uncharacterized protein n=1 Tax=Zizania palustris TaxID=103762 RepID=A0A8J5SA66_ZIZPA|nr:hypothetical protein GUJ93_ZPchr0001g30845 [Zizania palustris]
MCTLPCVDDDRLASYQQLVVVVVVVGRLHDLHHWLFHTRDTAPADASAVAAPPQLAHAFFVFRFELGDTAAVEDGDAAEAKEDLLDNAGKGAGAWAGYLGKWGQGD